MTAGRVLVTGAARRIGRVIARSLAGDGWAVAVHYAGSATDAENTVAEIAAAGGTAAAVAANLSAEDEAETLVDRAAAALGGPLTCLVNNAAVFENDSAASATRESWDRHLAVNLRAPFVLIQRFAAQLPADARGNVVNLLDQRVRNLTPAFVSYTMSKAGLWTLTRTLALALAPRIRVNAIGPGPVLPSARQSEAGFAAVATTTPLGVPVDAADIAAAVCFFLDTPSVTGQMIATDGGQHLLPGGPREPQP